MNIRIPKEKIIHFNVNRVYFLKGKKVYFGRRAVSAVRNSRGRATGTLSCSRESSTDLFVYKDSIRQIKRFNLTNQNCSEKTAKALKRHGVEIY